MRLNHNFAKATLRADGTPDYAPNAFNFNGRDYLHPTAEDYHAAGFVDVITAPPTDPAPEGYHYERTGKYAPSPDGQSVIAQYTLVDNPPPPPRRWTRLSIKTALATADMLGPAKVFLSSTEIATGYTAWEALTDCDYIEEFFGGAEKWNALLDGAANALGKSRAEIDAFLANIPTEG